MSTLSINGREVCCVSRTLAIFSPLLIVLYLGMQNCQGHLPQIVPFFAHCAQFSTFPTLLIKNLPSFFPFLAFGQKFQQLKFSWCTENFFSLCTEKISWCTENFFLLLLFSIWTFWNETQKISEQARTHSIFSKQDKWERCVKWNIVYGRWSFRWWIPAASWKNEATSVWTRVERIQEDMSKIHLYLLRYLKIHDDEVTLRLADLLYRHRRAICSAIAATADITQVVAMVR